MSHVVMKKNLAKALMDSGMHDVADEHLQHFGLGGLVHSILGGGGGSAPANYKPPPIVKQDFLPQIKTLQGEQGNVYGQQQSLANTLLNQSQGQGPNPAQAALNQNTGNNIAAQAALMASQRGASANPGQIARMAAQQGAATQQNAVGQGATLQAQQELAAQQALQQQQAAMANQALQGENIQQTGQAAQNNAINAGVNGANQLNAQANAANASASSGLLGGLLSAGGAALAGPLGGMLTGGLKSLFSPAASPIGGSNVSDYTSIMSKADGGEIPRTSFSRHLLNGGKVDGDAKVDGDNLKNDTVPTMLSPGEVVLPRSVTQSPDAVERAAKFVEHLQEEKKGGGKGYGKVLDAKKTLKDRIEHLEKMMCGGMVKAA